MASPNEFVVMGDHFTHTILSESVRWLYDIAVDRLDDALAQAVEPWEGKLINFPHDVQYIVHAQLNAAAWHRQPRGCAIAIGSSTPLLVLMACMQVAERYDLATALPKQDAQGRLIVFEDKPTIVTKLTAPITTEQVIDDVLYAFGQRHPVNNTFGFFLCEIALKFIAMHECMHVILGHTRYIQEQLGIGSFLEFSRPVDSTLTPAFSQTLEFIADRHTVRGMAVRLLKKDFDPFYLEHLINPCSIDEVTYLIRCLLTACCILFHLFPNNHRPIHYAKGSHPHPYLRARWLCNEVMNELGENLTSNLVPLEALTWTSASLSSNFQLPAHWQPAFQQDFNESTYEVYSDLVYEKMLKMAQQWQHKLWKEFAPLYP